jgi:uncharacterized membrane protein
MSTALFTGERASNDHVAAFIAHAGTCFAWFLAPLVVYLVLPRSSRWARFQALQSLLWSLFGTLVSIATCGLAIPIFLVWHVVAAMRTLSGDYEYPLVGEAARSAVYDV